MKKITLIALSVVMVASLGAFAIGQSQGSRASSHEAALAALKEKETRIVSKLNLTAGQRQKYDALQARLRSETDAMNGMKSGIVEKGIEINKMLHTELKKIFTPDQYALYNRLWAGDGAGYAHPGKANATFGKGRIVQSGGGIPVSDDDVLRRVGASAVQIEKVHNLYREMEAGRDELKAMWGSADSDAIWKKSMDLNQQVRAGIQKILTPTQYAEYKRIWDQAMAPMLERGKGIKVTFAKPGGDPPAASASGKGG